MPDQPGVLLPAKGPARASPPITPPAEPTRPDAAAHGVLIALTLSGPVWLAIGYAVWRLTSEGGAG